MTMSKAHIKASRKYNEKAYDRIELKVPKGKKAKLQIHAGKRDESLNGFVNRAIEETVERDEAGRPQII
jgi:predicted HicB family RNase H-like nuclease